MDTRDLAEKMIDTLLAAVPVPPTGSTDTVREPVLEVQTASAWLEVDTVTWRSWTGRRMVNGEEHHGPVFVLGAPDGSPPYVGSRACRCAACQEHVDPKYKPN